MQIIILVFCRILFLYPNKLKHMNIFWEIAIKAPHGDLYQSISKNEIDWQFNKNNQIDSWIAQKLNFFKPSRWMSWNDEEPLDYSLHKSKSNCGHTKGILVSNDEYVGYLCHSTPKWPSTFPVNKIPQSELIYGQSFFWICIPIQNNLNILNLLLDQIVLCEANIYINHFMIKEDKKKLITKDINTVFITPEISHIAKNSHWNLDLFENALSQIFKSKCHVETWLRPANQFKNPEVIDVKTIKWKNGTTYHESKDHSKWCVSFESPFIWIGDINHMHSQFKRGGGGFIINDPKIQNAFNSIISDDHVSYDHVHICE